MLSTPDERIIKRYANRKLYDKADSRYVTLQEIARLVRRGDEIKVIDNDSGEDLTSVTFAQIILEEEKKKTHLVSVPFLRGLIQSGEATVQDLTDRATRGMEALGGLTDKAGERVREVAEQSTRAFGDGLSIVDDLLSGTQSRLDTIRESAVESVDRLRGSTVFQNELERVEKSLRSLETAVAKLRDDEGTSEPLDGAGTDDVAEDEDAEEDKAEPKAGS